MNYRKKSLDTKGSGNRYKAMSSYDYTEKEAIDWVGGNLPTLEESVITFLKKNGVKPENSLLEIGCGPLRCSKPIINYLNKDNYFAVEGDSKLLEVGQKSLNDQERSKNPRFVCSWNFEIEKLNKTSFDVIFIQGVICHMPNEEIEKLFHKISKFLANNGSAFISFLNGTSTNFNEGVFYQTVDQLRQMSKDANLECENLGDWSHPRKLQMIKLTHFSKQ